jgi:hypothetical protein
MSTRGTTVRKVRVHDDTWTLGKAKAHNEGTDLSTVIREAVDAFLSAPPREWGPSDRGRALRPSEAVLERLEDL